MAALNAPPADLEAHGFRTDPAELRFEWRSRLDRIYGPEKTAAIAQLDDDLSRAKEIAKLLSGAPAAPRLSCGFTDDLEAKLRGLPSGEGCCSDFAQSFTALATIFGMSARTVQNSVHGFNEFYDRDRAKWTVIDAEYGFLVRNKAGIPLSGEELRRATVDGSDLALEFFLAPELSKVNRALLVESGYYTSASFNSLTYTWGSNVLERTQFNGRLGWLQSRFADSCRTQCRSRHTTAPSWIHARPRSRRSAHPVLDRICGRASCGGRVGVVDCIVHMRARLRRNRWETRNAVDDDPENAEAAE
ncbi:MAG: hypothetical protein U0263_26605 [Polyangiaceae bacterium]